MKWESYSKLLRRAWIVGVILIVVLAIWPVEYRLTRTLMLTGFVAVWLGALLLSWPRKILRMVLLILAAVLLGLVMLPGRPINRGELADDYVQALRCYRGVRYVWGGEGKLGIDCSGLVRRGLIRAQMGRGLRSLNGNLIRGAIQLWWNDCSAQALMAGYRGQTIELFRGESIAGVNELKLRTGDLAITRDGVHVLAFLGDGTWIEADPSLGQVIELPANSSSPWFSRPMVFVRWSSLTP